MTMGSSTETVAVLYDIENAPFEMLDYTLGKARKYLPCRMIVVSDWDERPNQKRWDKLIRRPGFTFRQVERTVDGKNSLDYALFDTAALLKQEGVQKFFIITTDSDFAKIAEMLKADGATAYIIGVGTKQASQLLRDAYDEFICYPPEQKVRKSLLKQAKQAKKAKARQAADEKRAAGRQVAEAAAKARPAAPVVVSSASDDGLLQVRLPKTLHQQLVNRMHTENVDMGQLVTYLLMRGLSQ